MSVRLLWDADYLVYAAGFAVEHVEYLLTVGTDNVYGGPYDGMEAVKPALEEARSAWGDDVQLWKKGPYLEEDGEIRAMHNTRSMIEGVLKEVESRYPRHKVKREMYLTGSGNFRDPIATIRPYKGNRATTAKPLLYRELRAYLQEQWGAEMVHGIEADDIISIRAEELIAKPTKGEKVVIVHVDKDLLMIPGVHLNPRRLQDNKPCWGKVSRERGLREFYRQLITGDTADNIPGIYRAGPAVAKAAIQPGMSEEEMWRVCVELYAASIEKHGEKCGYADKAPEEAALENARLLWLQTEPGQLWLPPGARGGEVEEQSDAA